MDGYSEIGAIYFSVDDRTSFAKFQDGKIITDTYVGAPPYKSIEGSVPYSLRQYHAAEHQVYNSFMEKIDRIANDASLEELAKFIPSMEEVEKTNPFSFFCGTTIFLMCGLTLLLSALPNLFRFHNTEFLFMLTWMTSSLVISSLICMWVQKKYFLAKPEKQQLRLGLEALKEVFRHGSSSYK